MSEQWAVEKAREWQQKSCSCGSFDSDQLVSKAECPECLAALLEEVAGEALATVQPALDAEKRERDEARAEGEQWRAASDTCEMECRKLRAEVERLREALGRVLTEAGLQAHKHGCANKIARPAQWDARLPCAGCQAESALQGR